MGVEYYKHEFGCKHDARNFQWRWYWEVNNTSGRNPQQIVGDIDQELSSLLGWWDQFRLWWAPRSRCNLFRFQRLLPSKSGWIDLYQEHKNDLDNAFREVNASQVACKINWICDGQVRERPSTMLRMIWTELLDDDQINEPFIPVFRIWCELSSQPFSTAYGDEFYHVHFDVNAIFHRIVGFWRDSRQRTRRINWRRS